MRASRRRHFWVLFLAALWGGVCGGPAWSQTPAAMSVAAVPVQDLGFGPLLPGVPERVTVGDAARRAEFLLTGQGVVELSIVLPTALTAANGAQVPLRFTATDAALLVNASAELIPLNPLAPIRIVLDPAVGPARLLIGGTALPALDLPAGLFTTRVVVVITRSGT